MSQVFKSQNVTLRFQALFEALIIANKTVQNDLRWPICRTRKHIGRIRIAKLIPSST